MAGVAATPAVVHMADGKQLEVLVANPDMVRWDMTAHKHKWPSMEEAPVLWSTFVTWRAAVRAGTYAGKWEDWSERDCLSVDMEVATEDEDPTQPGAGPDSV